LACLATSVVQGPGFCFWVAQAEPGQRPTKTIKKHSICQVELLQQSILFDGVPFHHTVVKVTIQSFEDDELVSTQVTTYEGVSQDKATGSTNTGPGAFLGMYWLNPAVHSGQEGPEYAGMSPYTSVWSTGMSQSECSFANRVKAVADTYRPNNNTYHPLGIGYPNSNAWTFTLLKRAGANVNIFTINPYSNPGWGVYITSW
jgi:hypothetical protein